MKYCKKCLQPDTRPGIVFDENQVCYACNYEQEKMGIDWMEREAELREIVETAKSTAKSKGVSYDCVIGVSGGKDSTFQAVYAKEKLGLNPLLVNGAPDQITEVGRKNLDNLSHLGFDLVSIRPNPQVARATALRGFREFGNIVKSSEYALWSSAYIIADKFDVPLIIQGENAALTLGTKAGMEATGDAFGVAQLNTLKGCNATDWVSDDIAIEQLFWYQFPDVADMWSKNIRAIYLQYYAKEWSQVGNADFAIARGLVGRSEESLHDLGRYRRYSALDADVSIVNQMIKYYKFGFGYATDEACYDIREGRLTREDALWYVNEYDGKCGERYIDEICTYLGITKEDFWDTVDRYVNRELFSKNEKGQWVPKFTVGVDFE